MLLVLSFPEQKCIQPYPGKFSWEMTHLFLFKLTRNVCLKGHEVLSMMYIYIFLLKALPWAPMKIWHCCSMLSSLLCSYDVYFWQVDWHQLNLILQIYICSDVHYLTGSIISWWWSVTFTGAIGKYCMKPVLGWLLPDFWGNRETVHVIKMISLSEKKLFVHI